jgi:hypothetical protein
MLTPVMSNIPEELKALQRWVAWRHEPRNPGDEPSKVPYDPRALNSRASSTDPATWGTFEQAETAYAEREGDADAFTGLGLVLNGDGLDGIDIDHCVTDGKPDPAALKLLDDLNAAYVEISPSGTGLRGFGYAPPLEKGVKGKYGALNVELYSTGRYLTLTGHTIKAGPLAPLKGFTEFAERIRGSGKTDPKTGDALPESPDERHAELVRRVLSGDVYHDSLRDLAASLIATGMKPGAVVNHLRGLMDASAAPKNGRWRARRGQIPDLVASAERKWGLPLPFNNMGDDTQRSHPLSLKNSVYLKDTPEAVNFVVDDFIQEGVVFVAGQQGVGKTSALLPLAMAQAGLHEFGYQFAPKHPDRWRHIIYITEDAQQANRIIAAMVTQRNFTLEQVRLRVHVIPAVAMDAKLFVQVSEEYAELLAADSGVALPPLVVCDTRSACFAVESENDNAEMSALVSALKQNFAGLPIWVIAHLAKDQVTRSNAATLSVRGAGSAEGDAHQVLFLVMEPQDKSRWLVRGKTRFESPWQELSLRSELVNVTAIDRWGDMVSMAVRWAVAEPPAASRAVLKDQAKAEAQDAEMAELRDDIRNAVQEAWNLGHPLNREGVASKVRKQRNTVKSVIEALLVEGWLYEVHVPTKERTNPNRKAFLVNLNTEQHEAYRADGEVPDELLVVPQSWRKKAEISSVPDSEQALLEEEQTETPLTSVPSPSVPLRKKPAVRTGMDGFHSPYPSVPKNNSTNGYGRVRTGTDAMHAIAEQMADQTQAVPTGVEVTE